MKVIYTLLDKICKERNEDLSRFLQWSVVTCLTILKLKSPFPKSMMKQVCKVFDYEVIPSIFAVDAEYFTDPAYS